MSELNWRFVRDRYRDEVSDLCGRIQEDLQVAKGVDPKYKNKMQVVNQAAAILKKEFRRGIEE